MHPQASVTPNAFLFPEHLQGQEGLLPLPLTPTCEAVSTGTTWGGGCGVRAPLAGQGCAGRRGPRGPGTGSPSVAAALARSGL